MSPQTLVCVCVCVMVTGRVKTSSIVSVLRGQDVVLGCFFTDASQRDDSGQITVRWSSRELQAAPFFTCSGNSCSAAPGSSSCLIPGLRLCLSVDLQRGDASLTIRDVQLSDEGSYLCSVQLKHSSSSQKIQLQVKAEPQILSLSVVDTPPSPDGAPQRLQCEVQGNPRPKIVWLSSSRRLTENQGAESESGQHGLISSVPYPEEGAELICRAENALGHAERAYPPGHMTTPTITLLVCGVMVVMVLLSTGGFVYCRRKRAEGNSVYDNTDADYRDTEMSVVYATVNLPSPASRVTLTH